MDFNHNGKDDLQEIKDGFDQFITDVSTGNINAVVKDVTDASAWLKGEIEGLEQDAQNFFNWGIGKLRLRARTLAKRLPICSLCFPTVTRARRLCRPILRVFLG